MVDHKNVTMPVYFTATHFTMAKKLLCTTVKKDPLLVMCRLARPEYNINTQPKLSTLLEKV